jgi:histidinol-phosphate aminotransferase
VSVVVGVAALSDRAYFRHTTKKIIEAREYTRTELLELGFTVLPSDANFLFISHPGLSGGELYARLKADGILVRHFNKERIDGFVRLTVGSDADMDAFLAKVKGYTL